MYIDISLTTYLFFALLIYLPGSLESSKFVIVTSVKMDIFQLIFFSIDGELIVRNKLIMYKSHRLRNFEIYKFKEKEKFRNTKKSRFRNYAEMTNPERCSKTSMYTAGV